jgi:hypothetical protein
MGAKITVGTFVTLVTEVCMVIRKSMVTLVTIPATVPGYRQQAYTPYNLQPPYKVSMVSLMANVFINVDGY